MIRKFFMASFAMAVCALSLVLFQMSSCKKADAQTTKNYPIEGLWIGSYYVDGQPNLGQQYFSFIIKPDGSMIADTKGVNQQHLAPGTWTLSGNTLSCSFTCVYGISQNIGVTETATSTWDKSGNLSSGVWKNIAPLNGSGTFTLTRVN